MLLGIQKPKINLSRCHCVFLNKQEDILGIVNIANDEITLYDILNNYQIKRVITLPQNCGPRHAVFNEDGNLIYTITEYSNEIYVIDANTSKILQVVKTISNNFKEKSYGGTLFFNKTKTILWGTNRGEDTIVSYQITKNGKLEHQTSFSCFGKHPRHTIISNDGKFIISANKNSNQVVVIDIDNKKQIKQIDFQEPSGLCEE